jgi:hypothetical protein
MTWSVQRRRAENMRRFTTVSAHGWPRGWAACHRSDTASCACQFPLGAVQRLHRVSAAPHGSGSTGLRPSGPERGCLADGRPGGRRTRHGGPECGRAERARPHPDRPDWSSIMLNRNRGPVTGGRSNQDGDSGRGGRHQAAANPEHNPAWRPSGQHHRSLSHPWEECGNVAARQKVVPTRHDRQPRLEIACTGPRRHCGCVHTATVTDPSGPARATRFPRAPLQRSRPRTIAATGDPGAVGPTRSRGATNQTQGFGSSADGQRLRMFTIRWCFCMAKANPSSEEGWRGSIMQCRPAHAGTSQPVKTGSSAEEPVG